MIISQNVSKAEGVCLHLFSGVARAVCRVTYINRISLRNVNVHAQLPMRRKREREREGERERNRISKRDWEMRIRAESLRNASAFKVLGRRRMGLFRAEEEQKPPERVGCCINIYTRKEGLLCGRAREEEVVDRRGRAKWNANALTSHWGTTGAHPSLGHECTCLSSTLAL